MKRRTGSSRHSKFVRPLLGLIIAAVALSLSGQTVPTLPPPPPRPPIPLPVPDDRDARIEEHGSVRPDPKDAAKTVQKLARRWKWQLDRFDIGDPTRRIEGYMAGKFRDTGRYYPHRSETWELCYQIDDFIEVSFFFDSDNRFTGSLAVYPKRKWLRDIDGKLLYRYPGDPNQPEFFETVVPR